MFRKKLTKLLTSSWGSELRKGRHRQEELSRGDHLGRRETATEPSHLPWGPGPSHGRVLDQVRQEYVVFLTQISICSPHWPQTGGHPPALAPQD